MTNKEVMRQARNAFVWNLNTDLDNIPACDQWAKMLRKNIDALDKAMADAELKWVGLTDEEIKRLGDLDLDSNYFGLWYDFARAIEAKLKEKNS
jgi:hypothetical protein